MFTINYREEVRTKLINKADSDDRITSAAVIGSYAHGNIDRWSDIDLTFGVDESYTVKEVLDSWTEYVINEFSAVILFDVTRLTTIYRVFILPGCLQLDLSFTSASDFGSVGKNFKLLFGKYIEKPEPKSPDTTGLFGLIVHHLLRARVCIERDRLWQAAYWINEARNYSLTIACLNNGLNTAYGRGFDDLPPDMFDLFRDSFMKELNREELMRSLRIIVSALPEVSEETNKLSERIFDILNEILV